MKELVVWWWFERRLVCLFWVGECFVGIEKGEDLVMLVFNLVIGDFGCKV